MEKGQGHSPKRLKAFMKNFLDYICLFILPQFIQPLTGRIKGRIYQLNRLYSKVFHGKKRISTFSSPSSNHSLVYGGDEYLEHYLEEKLSSLGLNKITKASQTNEKVDILKINRLDHPYYRNSGYLIIPDWVRAVLTLQKENIQDHFNRSARRAIKTLNERGFKYYVIKASKILDIFYHEFYQPYIKTIYAKSGIVKEYERLKLFSRRSYIINIKHDEITVALVYILPAKDSTFYVYGAGVQDNIDGEIRDLAKDAIYFFSIITAKEIGYKKIDFGLTRSFLTDGVLNYKRKWGCEFAIPEDSVYDIAIKPEKDIVKDFLDKNPLIFYDKKDISCLFYFRNRVPTQKEIESKISIWQGCGFQSFYCVSPQGFDFDNTWMGQSLSRVKMIHGEITDLLSS